MINQHGERTGGAVSVPERVTYADLLCTSSIGCLTAMYDAETLGKMFMPQVGHEDYALWLRILKDSKVAHGLNIPLALYRVRRTSVSGNKLRAAKYQWNIYRKVEKLPFAKSVGYFARYVVAGFNKKYLT